MGKSLVFAITFGGTASYESPNGRQIRNFRQNANFKIQITDKGQMPKSKWQMAILSGIAGRSRESSDLGGIGIPQHVRKSFITPLAPLTLRGEQESFPFQPDFPLKIRGIEGVITAIITPLAPLTLRGGTKISPFRVRGIKRGLPGRIHNSPSPSYLKRGTKNLPLRVRGIKGVITAVS
jgi:hypothetical protein